MAGSSSIYKRLAELERATSRHDSEIESLSEEQDRVFEHLQKIRANQSDSEAELARLWGRVQRLEAKLSKG